MDQMDLVRRSRLDAQISGSITTHVYQRADRVQRIVRVEERWRSTGRLGRGGFGEVFLEQCVRGEKRGELRAVKKLHNTDTDVNRELFAIALFSAPKYEHCFVQSFGWYELGSDIHITMEYIQNGHLGKCFKSALPEEQVQSIVSQLLEGVEHMHEYSLAHRDLKPENILVVRQGPLWWVKLADFGISKRVGVDKGGLRTQVGTTSFVAPEVLLSSPQAPYTIAVDLWSLGAITFLLLTGQAIFTHDWTVLEYAAGRSTLPLDLLNDKGVSEQGRSFVRGLLQAPPERRPTARQARSHHWFQKLPNATQATEDDRNSLAEDLLHPKSGVLLGEDHTIASKCWSVNESHTSNHDSGYHSINQLEHSTIDEEGPSPAAGQDAEDSSHFDFKPRLVVRSPTESFSRPSVSFQMESKRSSHAEISQNQIDNSKSGDNSAIIPSGYRDKPDDSRMQENVGPNRSTAKISESAVEPTSYRDRRSLSVDCQPAFASSPPLANLMLHRSRTEESPATRNDPGCQPPPKPAEIAEAARSASKLPAKDSELDRTSHGSVESGADPSVRRPPPPPFSPLDDRSSHHGESEENEKASTSQVSPNDDLLLDTLDTSDLTTQFDNSKAFAKTNSPWWRFIKETRAPEKIDECKVQFSPDGRWMSIARSRYPGPGTCSIFSTASWKLHRTIKKVGTDLTFSPDNRTVAWCKTLPEGMPEIVTYDILSGKYGYKFAYPTMRGEKAFVKMVGWTNQLPFGFSPDGLRLAVAFKIGSLSIWDMTDGKREGLVQPDTRSKVRGWARAAVGVNSVTTTVQFSQSGDYVACGTCGFGVVVRNARTGMITHRLQGHTSTIRNLRFTDDDKYLVTNSRGNTIRAWDLSSGKQCSEFADPLNCFSVDVDGETVFVMDQKSGKCTAKEYEVASGSLKAEFPVHEGVGIWIAQSRNGRVLGTAFSDRVVKLWDADSYEILQRFDDLAVRELIFSPYGVFIAIILKDYSVKIATTRPIPSRLPGLT